MNRFGWALVIAFVFWCICFAGMATAAVPPAALPYERSLIRETHAVYGLNGPVAVFAGQIEQESHWRPRVCSPFACGLTQFTAATAATMGQRYADLRPVDVYNPEWAIRALVRYDHDLYDQTPRMATECDDWAITLSAYNGGLNWTYRDQSLAHVHGADPRKWWGNVANWTERAPKYAAENRGYPEIILLTNQYHYADWGGEVACPSKAQALS